MFEEQENNVVLNENSVDRKPCINRESKSNELIIKLYSCHDIIMKFLVVVTQPSIYHFHRWYSNLDAWINLRWLFLQCFLYITITLCHHSFPHSYSWRHQHCIVCIGRSELLIFNLIVTCWTLSCNMNNYLDKYHLCV